MDLGYQSGSCVTESFTRRPASLRALSLSFFVFYGLVLFTSSMNTTIRIDPTVFRDRPCSFCIACWIFFCLAAFRPRGSIPPSRRCQGRKERNP